MIIEREEMQVLWTCPACEKENNIICPIWEDVYGEYVAVECPDCLKVEYVSLKEKN
jgi:predicted RNA-binding Zn-ribbon protein involved in translation (DUF1610 family)